MGKKTPLTVVQPGADPGLSPPATLGEFGSALWRSIQSEYGIADSGGLSTLAQICAAADRAEDCRMQIGRDGALIETKFGLRDHPLIKHELNARAFVVRALARLGLDIEPLKPVGRPGHGLRGYRGGR
jgi:hypothetical protein